MPAVTSKFTNQYQEILINPLNLNARDGLGSIPTRDEIRSIVSYIRLHTNEKHLLPIPRDRNWKSYFDLYGKSTWIHVYPESQLCYLRKTSLTNRRSAMKELLCVLFPIQSPCDYNLNTV